ncbi:MAG TPA: SDR family oxidoreductase [Acidimicrobiales bacterium]|nr:SDR family oxidoreductase [Acidimicrobiales bacterium]
MAVVLVTGGSGTLGSHLAPLLRGSGHEVRVLSRRAGRGTHVGDLNDGAGVAEAATGAEVVVHLASDTRRLGRKDQLQTGNLLSAVKQARLLVYISIVGIDRIPYAYYRRKLACEATIASSGVPFTILRATQFHELIALGLRAVERLPVAPLPVDFRFQPVAAAEVAARLSELVDSAPGGRVEDMGGPQVLSLGDLAQTWSRRRGRPRRVVRLPLPGRAAAAFRQGLNTCPEHMTSGQTWDEYVSSTVP